MRRHRYHRVARSESETESESDTETMRCISCKEMYAARDAGRAMSSPLDHAHRGASTSPGPLFPDVVLVASDDGFPPVPVPAHTAVLMEESRSGTIKISEVSYDALLAFVNYLHTAEAWLDEQRACELVLAKKYQVKHLKGFYKKFLVSKLNWDNSLMTYVFAHQHGAKLVLDATLCLITDNMDKLTKKEKYMELVEKDHRFVMEIYEAYLSKQVNTAVLKDTSIKSWLIVIKDFALFIIWIVGFVIFVYG
ncbi:hypothetical protein Goari_023547 [Gossypium aridum]|uniref:BTB domain-containing protein n=1 Tax=Gossypium aridum TaxID=34290 RepID=A0A7J8X3C2_GOSAI|nr:hypothetical protein [Gossypium aridum]